jgi:hypothetical protein
VSGGIIVGILLASIVLPAPGLLDKPEKFNDDEVSIKLRENDVEKLTIQGNMKKISDELGEKKKLKEDSERFAKFFNEKGNIY